MRPLSPKQTSTLLALLDLPHPTVRSVQAERGLASPNTVHKSLRQLRDRGLVEWADCRNGTLRLTVRGRCLALDLLANAGLGPARDIRERR